MRILFGAENDGVHISPDEPNAYEWWYFDAISDDGRYVLVVIFFLGTPMSPYYKAAADGKNPLPRDWCGVFVSLHERTASGKYRERAYAYNLYRAAPGGKSGFQSAPLAIKIGVSELRGSEAQVGSGFARTWDLSLNERCLWTGAVRADVLFSTGYTLKHVAPRGDSDSAHTWVCVAPDCRVSGAVTLAGGERVSFEGSGYHDHNFGLLPWRETRWAWERSHLEGESSRRTVIRYYLFEGSSGSAVKHGFVIDNDTVSSEEVVYTERRARDIQRSPFYRRYMAPVAVAGEGWQGAGFAVGEVFEPARLAEPVMATALWTRIRRRS